MKKIKKSNITSTPIEFNRRRGSEDIGRIIGKRLRLYRVKYEFTQTDVARKYDISKNSISAYERGTVVPPLDFIFSISEELGMTLNEFFEIEKPEKPNSFEEQTVLNLLNNSEPEAHKYIIEALRGIANAYPLSEK